jgi:hypothetical protein
VIGDLVTIECLGADDMSCFRIGTVVDLTGSVQWPGWLVNRVWVDIHRPDTLHVELKAFGGLDQMPLNA